MTSERAAATTSERAAVVEMRGISIQFPGVKALDGVDFTLYAGEVHSLMGENGAGKSTLIKALTGVYGIDDGVIRVEGTERQFRATADAQAAGIATVYQEVNLCQNLTVGENVMLGNEIRRAGMVDWKATHAAAATYLAELGVQIDTRSILASHSIAVQQLVAISRAMVVDTKVLVLDEPPRASTAARSSSCSAWSAICATAAWPSSSSHFLDQIYEISTVSPCCATAPGGGVPRRGTGPRTTRGEDDRRELGELDAISASAERHRPHRNAGAAHPLARPARTPSSRGPRRVPGRGRGIGGLLGSGRTELARLIAGADRPDDGTVQVSGYGFAHRVAAARSRPRHRVLVGDRRAEGIVGDLTVAENIVLGIQARRGALRKISGAERSRPSSRSTSRPSACARRPERPHPQLSAATSRRCSGAVAGHRSELLILDEPTRGIDVGAKADIQRKVAELAEKGSRSSSSLRARRSAAPRAARGRSARPS